MKIKTLLLGTVAAAGLSTAAMAADPAVLTSLDICDELMVTGLTISSDSNCLQISGGVEYEFKWGDYDAEDANWNPIGLRNFAIDGSDYDVASPGSIPAAGNYDWSSEVDAWLLFVATADSDFGPAKAVIKLDFDQDFTATNEVITAGTDRLRVEAAYVSVGDSTVLMAGLKGSVFNSGNDEPFNFLGMFNEAVADNVGGYSDGFGDGVAWSTGSGIAATSGHVIQVVSDLGNGVSISAGLEDLGGLGQFVGVLAYDGDGVAAHISFLADDILTGAVAQWGIHAGMDVTIDMFKLRAAVAYDDTGFWNALASAEATFDMFKIAVSVEGTSADEIGFGASVGADVTDTVSINLGARWFDYNTTLVNRDIWTVAAQVVAKVTESVTLTAEVGVDGESLNSTTVGYGSVEANWKPGGGFESSVELWANANSAYAVTFAAKKSF